ncbi:MAG: hypothetical protein QOJ40_345, partial [Verrucomicrobiota bacterium]
MKRRTSRPMVICLLLAASFSILTNGSLVNGFSATKAAAGEGGDTVVTQ